MQAAPVVPVPVVTILEQNLMGLADHETKVADTWVNTQAGCEDIAQLSDAVKHLRDDAGVSTGHAIALEDASEGLSLQVIVCTHACLMLPVPTPQSSAVAMFSDR